MATGAAPGRDSATPDPGFLRPTPPSAGAQRLHDEDVRELGYVMNVSQVRAHLPDAHDSLFGLLGPPRRPLD
jgi:hypothetical protein